VAVLDPQDVDLEMLASALADQGGYEHRWLFDPRTGETEFWSGDDPEYVDPDDDDGLDREGVEDQRRRVDPMPSWVWYQDMVDFAEQVSDEKAGRRLGRALDGKGAFRRFKNELHEEYPDLVAVWNAFRANRADVRAVQWLWDNGLVSYERYQEFRAEHPDPPIP
jgi:Uncharacterised protein family (UPF0158)